MATKKDYFKNAQVGKINKVALNNFFDQSPSYEIDLTKIDHATGEYEGNFKGKIKIMSYNKNFEDRVLEFIEKQEKANEDIKSRLDVLEKDMKEIKSLPTIQNELKNK